MMKLFRKEGWMAALLAAVMAVPLVSCGDDETTTTKVAHDPSKPIVCESFSPKGGPISTQVILTGQNFGCDPEMVKVYFNEKEDPVVGVNNDHILVLAPRLPGNDVVIKVCIGDKESCFDGFFDYEIQTNISTICGGDASATTNPEGTIPLSEAQFQNEFEWNIEIDKGGNIFFNFNVSDHGYRYVANVAADRLKRLEDVGAWLTCPQVIYDPIKDRVYHFQSNAGNNEYWWYDVNNDFCAMGKGQFTMDNDEYGYKDLAFVAPRRTAAMRPSDGKFYTRMLNGIVIRFDPETGIGENITGPVFGGQAVGTVNGTSSGIVFDKNDDNIFYFTNDDNNCIYKADLSTGRVSVYAGQVGSSGYLDGPLTTAQFNSPKQMCIDSEGNLFVADSKNHCIRKINTTTGFVSTAAGIPQTSGYVNGTSEFAKFNEPTGICIDQDDIIYVSDRKNHAIRRVAIE